MREQTFQDSSYIGCVRDKVGPGANPHGDKIKTRKRTNLIQGTTWPVGARPNLDQLQTFRTAVWLNHNYTGSLFHPLPSLPTLHTLLQNGQYTPYRHSTYSFLTIDFATGVSNKKSLNQINYFTRLYIRPKYTIQSTSISKLGIYNFLISNKKWVPWEKSP